MTSHSPRFAYRDRWLVTLCLVCIFSCCSNKAAACVVSLINSTKRQVYRLMLLIHRKTSACRVYIECDVLPSHSHFGRINVSDTVTELAKSHLIDFVRLLLFCSLRLLGFDRNNEMCISLRSLCAY